MNSKSTLLTLNEQSRRQILEVSALHGCSQGIIKEVYEYMMYNWAITLSDHPDDFACLKVPYLGSLYVKYKGDRVLPSGELGTDVEYFFELNDSFKKIVGDIHDEGYTELVPLMAKKAENAIMLAGTPD